jgi:hypothetical protein
MNSILVRIAMFLKAVEIEMVLLLEISMRSPKDSAYFCHTRSNRIALDDHHQAETSCSLDLRHLSILDADRTLLFSHVGET